MPDRSIRAPAKILATVLVLFAAGQASADWLVYKDGTRLETEGGWTTKGKLIVFSLPNGVLSAVNAREIDLDASRELTRSVRATPPGPVQIAPEVIEPRRKARIVITDADVGHVDPARFGTSPDAEPQTEVQESDLLVTKWARSEPDDDGILIVGHLRNDSDRAKTAVTVTVRALGKDDQILGEKSAILHATTLMPGGSTRFEARLDRVFTFQEMKFETTSIDLEVAAPDTPPPS